MIDIGKMPDILDIINAGLNNNKAIEIRPEKNGIAIVELNRSLRKKITYDDVDSRQRDE